jgi:ABC-type branched-subunit amino acid transport system substrate-binding protein
MSLTGDLAETPLPDLIEFFCLRQETVAVQVATAEGPGGVVFIEGGAVVDARVGELVGEPALQRALGFRKGDYRVERDVRCQQRTIFESWKKAVLEAARLRDEAARDAAIRAQTARREGSMAASGNSGNSGPKHTAPPISRPPAPAHSSNPTMTPVQRAPVQAQQQISQPPVVARAPQGASFKALGGAAVAVLLVVAAGLAVMGIRKQATPPQAAVTSVAAVVHVPSPVPMINGVTDTEITFGMAAPFSGSAKELGRGMKTGIEVAFAAANEQGGVNGRKLRLIALDDGYEPLRTKDVMRELVEQRKVFAVIGNVGTPTSAVAVPYALEKKVLFFGAFTGAGLLRKDPPDRYVFNYRSSYAEETSATVRYLVEQRRIKPDQIAVFAQEDGYGDAGFSGVANELRRRYKREPSSILRVGYKRNTVDVESAVEKILDTRDIKAVIMVPTYRAAARFIEKVREKKSDMVFTSVSFVGSSALAEEFQQLNPKLGEGVIVTQVVPLPTARSSVALRYQELLGKHAPGERPDFVSFEGYLAANVLIDALKKQGRGLDTEGLINTLEQLRGLDLGIGAQLSFGLSEHQASHKVWGTMLDAHGQYQSVELD